MTKAAIVVLSETKDHADLARVVNALETVKELKHAGDEVEPINCSDAWGDLAFSRPIAVIDKVW